MTRVEPSRSKQRGVSLLESVFAITIAGSVSAVAVPKLTGLTTDARVSVVKSMQGAVHSASTLMHMKCAVQAGCNLDAGESTLAVAGSSVRLSRGYPVGGDEEGVENALEYTGFTAVRSEGRTMFIKDGAPNAHACAVIYEEPRADGGSPVIATKTSGC